MYGCHRLWHPDMVFGKPCPDATACVFSLGDGMMRCELLKPYRSFQLANCCIVQHSSPGESHPCDFPLFPVWIRATRRCTYRCMYTFIFLISLISVSLFDGPEPCDRRTFRSKQQYIFQLNQKPYYWQVAYFEVTSRCGACFYF